MADADALPALNVAASDGLPPASQSASRHADGPLPPSPSTSAALRSWLEAERRARAAGDASTTAEDRRLLRQACEDARRGGVHVEQLIILVKQLWVTLPSRATVADRGDDWSADCRSRERAALERVVRLCIEEFYGTRVD